MSLNKLPITVIIPIFNEEKNLLNNLKIVKDNFEKVLVVDSFSTDNSAKICKKFNIELIQFKYNGGYPRKRQWILKKFKFKTPWVYFLDADEIITRDLIKEIAIEISDKSCDGFLIKKDFYFMGKKLTFGGFQFSTLSLFRHNRGNYENIFHDKDINLKNMDMEIHEKVIIKGKIKKLKNSVIHKDFKNLYNYLNKHNFYSSWEAKLRWNYKKKKKLGIKFVSPNLFGNVQEIRRFFKLLVMHLPFEHTIWFFWHYVVRLGFVHGKVGYVACKIRSDYIFQVNAKLLELNKIKYY